MRVTCLPSFARLWLLPNVSRLQGELECSPDGIVQVRLAEQLTTLLNDARIEDGWLRGRTTGDIGTDDANRHPKYVLRFNLKMRGPDVLNGAVTASADRPRSFAVTQWAELRRQKR